MWSYAATIGPWSPIRPAPLGPVLGRGVRIVPGDLVLERVCPEPSTPRSHPPRRPIRCSPSGVSS